MDFLSTFAGMDPRDIPERLRQAGKSQADLSRYIPLDPSSLTKTIKGLRQLKATELLKIEEFFGEPANDTEPRAFNAPPRRGTPLGKIPVFGYAAAGGEERIAFNDGQVVEWIDAPPFGGAGDYFGVRVLSDSMVPRFFEGELAIAKRNLPPSRDQDCIVEFKDGSGLIKTYKRQKDGKVFVHQWNPDQELSFEGASVKALHAVEWSRR